MPPSEENQKQSRDLSIAKAEFKRLPYRTIILCSLFTILACQRQTAFVTIDFVLLIIFPWSAYVGYIAIRRPQTRRLAIMRLLIWIAGIGIASGAQAYIFFSTQRDGLRVSSAVENYIVAKGSCPQTLEDIGIETTDDRKHNKLANFDCDDGKPNLWYFSTYTAFDMEEYDFQNHKWVHTEVDL